MVKSKSSVTVKSNSVGVSRGVVSNIERTVSSIKQAVQAAEEDSGVGIKIVNVGIAGQHIKSLQHRGMITRENIDDEISRKDINDLIDDMSRLSHATRSTNTSRFTTRVHSR